MRIGVISDTHIPGRARHLPQKVFEVFGGVDAILHAGDLVSGSVLEELGDFAPAYAVLGNMDHWDLRGVLPEKATFDFAGVKVGMVHDSRLNQGRRERMRAAFPGCRVVVFGHSHQPMIEEDGGLLLLNPGSACDPRRARVPTVAILKIEGGKPAAELLEL